MVSQRRGLGSNRLVSPTFLKAAAPFLLLLGLAGCAPTCRDEPPETTWDPPLCSDEAFDTSLLDNATHGDHSAVELLERRFETAFTIQERHSIARGLLKLVPDDSRYWNELAVHAEQAIQPQDRIDAYCAEQRCDPDRYRQIAISALGVIGPDPRAHPLLLRALETDDVQLVYLAIDDLGVQHDEASLQAIDRSLARFPDDASASLASALASFQSETADAVAMKYLKDDEDRKQYRELCVAHPLSRPD